MKQEVEMFKIEYMGLIEECDKLRQKLNDSQKMHGYMDKHLLKTHEMCEQLRKEASQAKNDASVLKARVEGAVTTLLLLAEEDRPKTQSQKGYLAFNNDETAPNGGQILQFLTTGRLSVPDDQQPYQDVSPSLLTNTSNLSVSAVTPNQKASLRLCVTCSTLPTPALAIFPLGPQVNETCTRYRVPSSRKYPLFDNDF
jgi:hypothetical protein